MSLNLCVVGLNHGNGFLPLIRECPRTRLTSVVDIDAERLSSAAAEYDVAAFASIDEMLNASAADAAILAIPTAHHAEASVACLNAGMHVLQEKPLCRTDEEATAIRAAVAQSGKVFQVGYEVRSSPLHQTILTHIANGDLGQLTNVWYNQHTLESHAKDAWRSERSNMGGKLFDCAVHYLDLIQQWANAPLVRVAALGNRLGETGANADDLPQSAAIALEYANGVRGTFNFGAVNSFGDDASLGAAGTCGRIMGNPWLPEGAGSLELRMDGGVRKGTIVFDGNKTSRGHLGFREEFAGFVSAILDGMPNACSVEDAIAIHRMMAAIDRSLATGEIVTIES